MNIKRIKNMVVFLIAALVCIFVILALKAKDVNAGFINSVAGISSLFVAVFTAVNIIVVSHQIEITNNQLEEMKTSRQLQEQPFFVVENDALDIEKPCFFYTPPNDEYSFLSRYFYSGNIRNVSSFPAVEVDNTAKLIVEHKGEVFFMPTTTKQFSVIEAGGEKSFSLMFTGDETTWLYDSLRELQAEKLPTVSYTIMYKNLCGGMFRIEDEKLLIPNDPDENAIIRWHSAITKAQTESKEAIELLRVIREKDESKWSDAFKTIKDDFSKDIEEYEDRIAIKCGFKPNRHSFSSITSEEYQKEKSKLSYGERIHKMGSCAMRKNP